MRLTTFGLHRAYMRRASDLFARFIARVDAPAASLCDNCLGVGRDYWQQDCDACHGRGWRPNADPIQLLATALAFLAAMTAFTIFLWAVAP